MSDEATDAERYPTLTEAGRRMLAFMREHPAAPLFRNRSGNRLLATDLPGLREAGRQTLTAAIGWSPGQPPGWLPEFVQRVFEQVPFYRALGAPPARFTDVPPVGRGELAADIARFVPDEVALERMINFQTTGTTGQRLLIPSHPVVAARYLAYHQRALRRFGITLEHGRGQVGVVLLGHQRECFTYTSVNPLLDESGLAKINLHPDDWRDPDDRARYLDAMAPELLAGDPISFATLLTLPVTCRPRALLSVSMALSAGLRERLAARFGCPVLDVYSLNEVGPVAVFDPAVAGHVLLQPELYVEVLDEHDRVLPPGARGQIVVSGGFNFCLPLLRYRTGDWGALVAGVDAPALVGLAGRQPVRFRTAGGMWINNIDVSHALKTIAFSRFGLHQHTDGRLALQVPPGEHHLVAAALAILTPLFGALPITVETILAEDKFLQFTSDLTGALAA